jgi:hypothetical protein
MTVRIAYPTAQSRGIVKDGVAVDTNGWDETLRAYGPIM